MDKRITVLAVAMLALHLAASYAFSSGLLLEGVNSRCGASYDCGTCHLDPDSGSLNLDGRVYNNFGNDPCYFCPDVCNPPGKKCTDNDGDGFFAEYGCGTPRDCNDDSRTDYLGAVEICDDKIDNNCNGQIDCDDQDCEYDPACGPTPICTNYDGDPYYRERGCGTAVDCDDSDLGVNTGAAENCTDGFDNDCDGLVDCADNDCNDSPDCIFGVAHESCSDGIDNDGDGLIDCAEPGCRGHLACTIPEGRGKACEDGLDNDGDGLVDCEDPGCKNYATCIELLREKERVEYDRRNKVFGK